MRIFESRLKNLEKLLTSTENPKFKIIEYDMNSERSEEAIERFKAQNNNLSNCRLIVALPKKRALEI